MPDPVTGVVAGTSVLGSAVQSRSASRASRAQQQAADAQIAEQRRQFDVVRGLLQPYVSAGGPALQGLMDIAGIGAGRFDAQSYFRNNPDVAREWTRIQGQGQFNSPEEYAQWHFENFGRGEGRAEPLTQNGQQAAVNAIEQSPMFQAIARQGEDAILQNASATGGLRGGNTQGALARFRPQLLNQFIEQQYGRLAGIAGMGQNSAAGVGSAAMQTGQGVSSALGQAGLAQAGGIGAQGQIFGNLIGNIGGAFAAGLRPGGPQASLLPSVNNAMAANPGLF